jgi:hypothetical protein
MLAEVLGGSLDLEAADEAQSITAAGMGEQLLITDPSIALR